MNKKPVPIIVSDIHLLQVEIVKQRMEVNALENEFKLSVAHKMLHNLEDERLKFEFVFSFTNDGEEPLFLFQIDFHFHIANLENFYELKDEKQPVFSAHLIATLIGIAFSTARGIIFEKLNSAGIQNILLPIVSPQEMLTKPKAE